MILNRTNKFCKKRVETESKEVSELEEKQVRLNSSNSNFFQKDKNIQISRIFGMQLIRSATDSECN